MHVTEHDAIRICHARVIDPFTGRDETGDLAIVHGRIADDAPAGARVIDAAGWIVCPGLCDMHVHLREPGQTHKETIESGTRAAAAGGFTSVACMPNTDPPLDNPDAVRRVLAEANRAGHCRVLPVACITRGRHGRELVDFAALRDAGAAAFSDDGSGVEDDRVMRAAFEQAARHDLLLIQHCEYRALSAGGVMHLGEVSDRLDLPGLDPRSEEAMIERDLGLCRETGGRYHVAHISTATAVDLIRRAKADSLPVTAEVTPHHLLLTHEACADRDPNTKMHPPLRTAEDVAACRHGLLDGTTDCIATDHAPHTAREKAAGFLSAPPGIVGLETAAGLAVRAMIQDAGADWPALLRWFTTGPKRVLGGVPEGRGPNDPADHGLISGRTADLTLIDPEAAWTVDPAFFASKSANTPFSGWNLTGRPQATIRGHRLSAMTDIPLHHG
ncbi:MAG: dihydroorotase [Phycisphaerae bacterium]